LRRLDAVVLRQELDRADAEEASAPDQHRRRQPIDPALVLLDLLKRDAERIAQLGLRQLAEQTCAAKIQPDLDIDHVRNARWLRTATRLSRHDVPFAMA